MFCFLILASYARTTRYEEAFCLKAKNVLGRSAPSALPHYNTYLKVIYPTLICLCLDNRRPNRHFAPAAESRSCPLIGIVRQSDAKDCSAIEIVQTIDFGNSLLIGFVRTIVLGDCLLPGN